MHVHVVYRTKTQIGCNNHCFVFI